MISQTTPTVVASDAGGTYNGQPYAATTSVSGISNSPVVNNAPWR